MWTFQGLKVFSERKDHLYQFLWRPRPALLTRAAPAEGEGATGVGAGVTLAQYNRERLREKLKGYVKRKRAEGAFAGAEAAGRALWGRRKDARRALGVVDDDDAGILQPVTYEVVVSEKASK